MKPSPCPFCGGEAVVVRVNNSLRIECEDCKIRTAGVSRSQDAIAAWNRRPGWVSVEKRLPEDLRDVYLSMVRGGIRYYGVGYFDDYRKKFMPANVEPADCSGLCVFQEGMKITHWMPLPEPPEDA